MVKVADVVGATPPAGFDPTTASDADLKKYGFPHQPQGNNDQWKAAMKAAKHKSTDTTSWSCPGYTHSTGQPAQTQTQNNVVAATSSPGPSTYVAWNIWAGNRVDNTNVDETEWEWIVPAGYPKTPNTCNSMVSPWTGMGSGNAYDSIVQAGSEDHYDCNGYNVHYMWHMVYPEGGIAFEHPFSFGIGDDIFVHVWVVNYDAYYFMEDLTKGQYNTYHEGFSGFTGNQAEWVVEKGSNGLTAWNGAMTTKNAWWHEPGGGWYTAGAVAHDSLHMIVNGVDVAHGGAWTDPGVYANFPIYSSGT